LQQVFDKTASHDGTFNKITGITYFFYLHPNSFLYEWRQKNSFTHETIFKSDEDTTTLSKYFADLSRYQNN
jgi:hypothetical protein